MLRNSSLADAAFVIEGSFCIKWLVATFFLETSTWKWNLPLWNLDCNPLVSGITSYGSANGASSADVSFLRQHNLDLPLLPWALDRLTKLETQM